MLIVLGLAIMTGIISGALVWALEQLLTNNKEDK